MGTVLLLLVFLLLSFVSGALMVHRDKDTRQVGFFILVLILIGGVSVIIELCGYDVLVWFICLGAILGGWAVGFISVTKPAQRQEKIERL